MEPSIKSKSAEHKTKASFETSIWSLKNRLVEPLNFKTLRLNIELFFLKRWNLYVRPVSGIVWNLLSLMWNLDPKPFCGTFMQNLYVKLFFGTFINPFAKRLCGTFYVELREPKSFRGTFQRNLGTFICGTWVRVKPLCGTLGNLILYVEPELLRVES